jgi:hypothetical protein
MDLAALEEIRRLKYRYLRCVDLKLWDEMADVFTPDATVDYGTRALGQPVRLAGRDEIVAFLRDRLGPDIITVHFASQPEIDVDGDEASGTWSFEDTVIATEYRVLIKGRRSTRTVTRGAGTAGGGSRTPATSAPMRS